MAKNSGIPEIRNFVFRAIEKEAGFKVDYFEIADDDELITVNGRNEYRKDKAYHACIAVKAGNIRLIDNIKI